MEVGIKEYLSDIENLIDNGKIDEAISHCKHILRKYPKYIDVYRLLGKAFLENQFYKEASDIFSRILSVFPDDFVSLLGQSIISEENKDLNGAIWYMDHAYEIQPSNTAIKNELKRLYGIRDGVEPSNIYLSKGVLVRMYAKGKLFPQAIAEAQAALEDDPKRVDLEVLLADLFYQSGEESKAIEIANSILEKTPYNYTAHYILADLLDKTSQTKEAHYHQQTVIALDPYKSIKSFQFTSDDNNGFIESLMIDRLENFKPDVDLTQQTKSAFDEIPESVIHLEDQSQPYETYLPDINATRNFSETLDETDGFKKEDTPFDDDFDETNQAIPDWLQQNDETDLHEDYEAETEQTSPLNINLDLTPDDKTDEPLSSDQISKVEPFLDQLKEDTIPIGEENLSPKPFEDIFTTEVDPFKLEEKESVEGENNGTTFTPPFVEGSSEGVFEDLFTADVNENETEKEEENRQEETNDWLERIKELDNIEDEQEDASVSPGEQNFTSPFEKETQGGVHEELHDGLKDDTDEVQDEDIDSKIEWLESLNIDNALKDSPIISPPENQSVVPQEWLEQHVSNNLEDTVPSTPEEETASDIEDEVLDSINKEFDVKSSTTEDAPIFAESDDDGENNEIPKLSDLEASSFEEERINTIINDSSEWIKDEIADKEDDVIKDEDSLITESEKFEPLTNDNENVIEENKMDTVIDTGGLTLSEWLSLSEDDEKEMSSISEVQEEIPGEVQEEIQDEIQNAEELDQEKTTIASPTEEFIDELENVEKEYQEDLQEEVQDEIQDEESLIQKEETVSPPIGKIEDILQSEEDKIQEEIIEEIPEDVFGEIQEEEKPIEEISPISEPTEEIDNVLQIEENESYEQFSQPEEPEIAESGQIDDPINIARSALQNNDLGNAIHQYYELIENPANVDKIIQDLNAVTSMYSTNFSYWQLLGDIYVKNNRLQDALDAYTKAERLLN